MTKIVADVWTFKSESSNAEYETLAYTDGTTSCSCPGWTRRVDAQGRRTCKHTRKVDMGTASIDCEEHVCYAEEKGNPPSVEVATQTQAKKPETKFVRKFIT